MTQNPEYMRRGAVLRALKCSKRVLRGLLDSGRLTPRKFYARGRAVFLRSEVETVKREILGDGGSHA